MMLGLIAYRAMQRLWDNHALYRSGMRPRLLLADMADSGGVHSQVCSVSTRPSGKYMRWVAFHVVYVDPVRQQAVSAGVVFAVDR